MSFVLSYERYYFHVYNYHLFRRKLVDHLSACYFRHPSVLVLVVCDDVKNDEERKKKYKRKKKEDEQNEENKKR